MTRQQSEALRVLGCAAVMILFYIVESSLGRFISVFGTHFDFLPPMVAATAILFGCPAGMVCGVLAGFLYDVSGAQLEGLYPLYFMLCGIVCGMIRDWYRIHRIALTAIFSVGMTLILSIVRYLFYFQFTVNTGVLYYIKGMVLQSILTAVICPLAFWIVRCIAESKWQKGEQDKPARRTSDG